MAACGRRNPVHFGLTRHLVGYAAAQDANRNPKKIKNQAPQLAASSFCVATLARLLLPSAWGSNNFAHRSFLRLLARNWKQHLTLPRNPLSAPLLRRRLAASLFWSPHTQLDSCSVFDCFLQSAVSPVAGCRILFLHFIQLPYEHSLTLQSNSHRHPAHPE